MHLDRGPIPDRSEDKSGRDRIGGNVKKLLIVGLFVLVLACSWPMSRVDLCYRPKDIMTTERVYDQATDTYIQYRPSTTECVPLNFPEDRGILYTRLQWRIK